MKKTSNYNYEMSNSKYISVKQIHFLPKMLQTVKNKHYLCAANAHGDALK